MPRTARGPHLWLRPAYYDPKTGKLRKRAVWCIVDNGKKSVTGCGLEDREGAEKKFAEYLADKHEPDRHRGKSALEVSVADVIRIYLEERVPDQARPEQAAMRAIPLLEFFGALSLMQVTGKRCRDYVAWRCTHTWKSARPEKTGNKPRMVTAAGARRELEDLRAAINYHQAEGYHYENIKVTLPKKSEPKDRFLLRHEAAKLIWTAWRMREQRKILQGPKAGRLAESGRATSKHIARFLILGIYTGTRAGAIAAAAFVPTEGYGWVDLEAGLWHRRPIGKRETNKRQPPVRIPRRLLAHLRRWKRLNPDQKFVVEFNGAPVKEVNKGFAVVVRRAELEGEITPHTLRHTCATWLMQRGADLWSASGYLGMTYSMLESVYGHHHPSFQSSHMAPPPLDEIWSPKYHPTVVVSDPYVSSENKAA